MCCAYYLYLATLAALGSNPRAQFRPLRRALLFDPAGFCACATVAGFDGRMIPDTG